MRNEWIWMAAVVSVALVSGCRSRTRVADVPRVDIELEGAGNRGYLVGTPPPLSERRTTRQMVETTIELPGAAAPLGPRSTAGAEESSPAGQAAGGATLEDSAGALDVPSEEPSKWAASPAPSSVDSYKVQKGDSLWSIAAKPEVYGKATRWRDLYEANRDLLKSPNDVRAGMSLKVPRYAQGSTTYDDNTITVKK